MRCQGLWCFLVLAALKGFFLCAFRVDKGDASPPPLSHSSEEGLFGGEAGQTLGTCISGVACIQTSFVFLFPPVNLHLL